MKVTFDDQVFVVKTRQVAVGLRGQALIVAPRLEAQMSAAGKPSNKQGVTFMASPDQIVIGGLGGSGTRAVAMAIEKVGYHCGPWLRAAHDNMLFATLLKSPRLLFHPDRNTRVEHRLQLFANIMQHGLHLRHILKQPRLAQYWRQLGSQGLAGQPEALGWLAKEPNSHLVVEAMTQLFPELRYIHVTRHPLDMAFSRNKKQLHLWGKLLGVDLEKATSLESAQLDYWIKVQENIAAVEKLKPHQCAILDFDAFCSSPQAELVRVLNRLNLPHLPDSFPEAVDHVAVPATSGRWQNRKLDIFSDEQLSTCRRLGWKITRPERL